MDKSELSMFQAMEACHVSEIPPAWNGRDVWVTALCKVRKSDCCEYWCYMEIDDNGKPRIVQDFGRCAAIIEHISYHPLSYLEPSYVKRFKKDEEGTAKLVEYLKNEGVVMDFENADRKKLDKANIRVAIKRQLADEKKANTIIIKD